MPLASYGCTFKNWDWGSMRALKLLAACIASCLAVLAGFTGVALAEESAFGESGIKGSPLVIEAAQELLGGEQLRAQREVELDNPTAVEERRASRTRYRGLDAAAALELARSAFPRVVDQPAGGLPPMPAGEQLAGYVTSNAASVTLPGGRHGLVESLQPIAMSTGHGRFQPIDLALHQAGDGYQPTTSDVAVQIPKRLSSGVSMSSDGVTLTPVDASGQPLEGSAGTLDGASVVYANTQADTDTLVKPTTDGVQVDSLLRSSDSPEELYYKVSMPAGAKLVSDPRAAAARVVLGGQTIAAIAAPSARDAAGTNVPLRTRVLGSTLVLTVAHSSSEYQYPIDVDPFIFSWDGSLAPEHTSNWRYHASNPSKFEHFESGEAIDMTSVGSFAKGEYDELIYEARHQASVMRIEEESTVANGPDATTTLAFMYGTSGIENQLTLENGEGYTSYVQSLCVPLGAKYCGEGTINLDNRIIFQQLAKTPGPEEYGFWSALQWAIVGVRQEKGPEVSFNTSEPNLPEDYDRQNVLYGSGGWLGPSNGAFEIETSDPGVGVSNVELSPEFGSYEFKDPILAEGYCSGVWCTPTYKTHITYSSSLPNGEDPFELCAEDATKARSCTYAMVKIDNTPPREIKLKGIAESGAELSAAPHQITVEATDGTSPTPSSGIKSIAVSIDGKEIGAPAGACSPGECTASGTWTIDGESLGAGVHELVVTATDYAGNKFAREYTFAIRNATPMKVGPGTVDPVTGQLALGAADVDVAGVGGVSRSYLSRTPNANSEGPLGPQWTLNVGAGASLTVQPKGSVELRGADGRLTTFAYEKSGVFASPKGDGNMKLEAKEKEAGHGITEYVLTNPTAGSTSRFTLPSGSHTWMLASSEGTAPSEKTSYGYLTDERPTEYSLGASSGPEGISVGPDGNLWVAQSKESSDTISKVTTAGAVTPYKLTSPFSCPTYIAAGSNEEGALWFTDDCNHQIGRITPGGVTTAYNFPSGVSLAAIVAGPDGNMWFAMEGTSKIGKITPSGTISEYALPAGSKPAGIVAGPDGNLWFTDYGTSRVGKITTSGTITEYALPSGSLPYGIASGPDGKLWFTDYGTSRVGKITTSGTITEYALPSGSEPRAIAAGPAASLWFTDFATSKIGKVTTAGIISEYPLPAGSEPSNIVQGPDGNVWYTDYGTGKVGVLKPLIKPAEVLGPVPSGVSCGKNPEEVNLGELKAGCRALTFTYTETGKTTATGESSSGWGEYEHQLAKVSFTAYNPSSKAMQTTAMAQYSYDSNGKLRAEWDPRISPALKTTYGYDAEGHVTALAPPDQQPWLFHYGAIAGDENKGRLLSVTRPGSLTSFGTGSAPVNTTVPTLSSTSPAIGTTLSVSFNGAWSNEPLAYSYQWQDCNSAGAECVAIVGAVNQSYTPQARDAGYTLVAQVTAQNATGVATSVSAASKVVPMSSPGSPTSLTAGFALPETPALAANGNVWVTDYSNNRVVELSSSGALIEAVGFGVSNGESKFEICTASCRAGVAGSGNGQFSAPWGLAVNQSTGNVYVGDSGNYRIEELNEKGEFVRSFGQHGTGHGTFGNVNGLTVDPSGNLWVADYANNHVEEFSETGAYMTEIGSAGSGNGQMSGPFGIAFSGGHIYVAEYTNDRVQELTTAGAYIAQWGKKGSGEGEFEFEQMAGIAAEPNSGDLYVTDCKKNQVRVFNPAGTFIAKFGGSGIEVGKFSCPVGIALDGSGHVYVADDGNNRIEKWLTTYSTNNPAPTPPSAGSNAIATIEYRVPLSGSSAPYQMTSGELAKWGQKEDLPAEATAVFPPDEPMGWPAANYKRASITYMDGQARMVNSASPSGGIATVEYNSLNEVTRTLSATNRAIALKEGSKSAEVAEALSTKNVYNSEGTQLVETEGPEHKIKLASGAEEETRDHEKLSYN
jgi:streptogramin lyase